MWEVDAVGWFAPVPVAVRLVDDLVDALLRHRERLGRLSAGDRILASESGTGQQRFEPDAALPGDGFDVAGDRFGQRELVELLYPCRELVGVGPPLQVLFEAALQADLPNGDLTAWQQISESRVSPPHLAGPRFVCELADPFGHAAQPGRLGFSSTSFGFGVASRFGEFGLVPGDPLVAGVPEVFDGLDAGIPPAQHIRLRHSVEPCHFFPDPLPMQHGHGSGSEWKRCWIQTSWPWCVEDPLVVSHDAHATRSLDVA